MTKRSKSLTAGLATACVIACIASLIQPANAVNVYRYYVNTYNGTPAIQWKRDSKLNNTAGNLFPDAKTDAERWKSFLESDYIIGKSRTNRVLAWDVSEDWTVNFINPGNDRLNYYQALNGDTASTVDRNGYPLKLKNEGPHANESIFNNNDLLAFCDDRYIFFDPDGTLSAYSYAGGGVVADYAWTTFTGGYWAGQSLAGKLQYMIGAEENSLVFLDGSSRIVTYYLNGSAPSVSSYDLILSGDLEGYTLLDVIQGKVENYTYIGWDIGAMIVNVDADFGPTRNIPEPSTAILGIAGIAGFMLRRRRKN